MAGTPASFPELDAERAHLAASRRARERMIDELEAVDPTAAADEITSEYVEMTVAEALDDLRSPGAGDFFGRIDLRRDHTPERYYIGRRHIEDADHEPMVIDWRAPVAAVFYRATAVDPLDVELRRRFMLADGDLDSYLDERLDDPDGGDVAAGIPDPVLAEIGAARTGAMREIVATIQAEQDLVIRAPLDQTLVVQGGPGTGKTAVALHRAAYLLFEHRRLLSREGVLVVGPNRAFLDYIGHVLPSLGERSVRQCTALDLCAPKVDVTIVDDADTAARKGSAEFLALLEEAAEAHIGVPTDDVSFPYGARRLRFAAAELAEWIERARDGVVPINDRRQRLLAIAEREVRRRSDSDAAWAAAGPLRAALQAAWPSQHPVRVTARLLADHFGGRRGPSRPWSITDQLLIDEANSLLNGVTQTFGHVVVDEAQDHSAVALRVIGRRSPNGSMTLVGDVAQSTSPGGQLRWSDVFGALDGARRSTVTARPAVAELTIGYRVPEPILVAANRLLGRTGVDATASRSVRDVGAPPAHHRVGRGDDLASAVAGVVADVKHRHRLTGVVAPLARHDDITAAFADRGFTTVDHLHELAATDVPLFGPEAVKGLEFDGVVIVAPDEIDDGSARGARLMYVAMTRAVQELAIVEHASPA